MSGRHLTFRWSIHTKRKKTLATVSSEWVFRFHDFGIPLTNIAWHCPKSFNYKEQKPRYKIFK